MQPCDLETSRRVTEVSELMKGRGEWLQVCSINDKWDQVRACAVIGKGVGQADPWHYPPPEGATRAVIETPGRGVGALDGAEQTESQGDIEAPEGLGGASGSGDWGGGGDPECRGGAGVTEDKGRAEGKEEPDRAGGTEWWGEDRGVESWGGGWSMTDQGGARGTREPGGAGGRTGHGGDEGARSQGGADGSKDRDGVQGLEAGGGDRGSSRLGGAGGWKSRGSRSEHPADADWGRAEGLAGSSGDRVEELAGFGITVITITVKI